MRVYGFYLDRSVNVSWRILFFFWVISHTGLVTVDASPTVDNYPSTMIAIGAYVPEDSYTSTDMSMPKYNTAGTAEMLAAPGSKLAGAGGEAKTVKVTVKKGEDPEKALARAQQEAEKREAKAKKLAETEAKMAAKKAERAKIQGKRES